MINFTKIKWNNYHGALLPDLTPDIEISLSKKEADKLLSKQKALFLRYTSEWDSGQKRSFWFVVKDSFHGMSELSGNTRSKLRRGWKYFDVRKVTIEEIVRNGYEVYKHAFSRYNTHLKPVSKQKFYENTMNSIDYDFFAVYEKKSQKMVAYSSNKIINDVCNYTTIKFHPNYLKYYSGYVLIYEMNKYYLQERKFKYIHDGARSIVHDTNIHDFLIDKFKFRKAYCQLNIFYRWDIQLAVRLLYPFRAILNKKTSSIMKKISAVLKQEEIRRSFG